MLGVEKTDPYELFPYWSNLVVAFPFSLSPSLMTKDKVTRMISLRVTGNAYPPVEN